MKLKPDIKARWIEALTSGEYQQGRGTLRTNDDKYCCLGVLCDLAVKAGVGRWIAGPLAPMGYYVDRDAPDDIDFSRVTTGVLPRNVVTWAFGNMPLATIDRYVDPEVERAERRVSLAGLNDFGVPFTEIADAIERSL